MRVVQRALLGDTNQQHRIEPLLLLGANCTASAALRASANPRDRVLTRRLADSKLAQSGSRRFGVGTTKPFVIDHGTGIEASTASRA